MREQVETVVGGRELLDRVAPLWEALNRFHRECSTHFGHALGAGGFAARRAELLEKASAIRVEVACGPGGDVGYCIGTLDSGGRGEIDSLFVKEECRGAGLGRRLALSAMGWLEVSGASPIDLMVVAGNRAAIDFYERLGFYPRNVHLVRKQE